MSLSLFFVEKSTRTEISLAKTWSNFFDFSFSCDVRMHHTGGSTVVVRIGAATTATDAADVSTRVRYAQISREGISILTVAGGITVHAVPGCRHVRIEIRPVRIIRIR